MRIVLTRPQEDSARTAATLRARGHEALVAPLMRIETVAAKIAPSWGGVIITSANAASALMHHPARAALIKLPAFAVGQRSADAARQAGFTEVTSAGGDVRDLMRTLMAKRPDKMAPLLYLAGEDRAGDLIGDLAVRGIAAELAVVYRAALAPFPAELIAALKAGEVDAVLHYSKRSSERYVSGAQAASVADAALAVRHVCLSAQVAEPLRAAGAGHIDVAQRPDEAALLDCVSASSV